MKVQFFFVNKILENNIFLIFCIIYILTRGMTSVIKSIDGDFQSLEIYIWWSRRIVFIDNGHDFYDYSYIQNRLALILNIV